MLDGITQQLGRQHTVKIGGPDTRLSVNEYSFAKAMPSAGFSNFGGTFEPDTGLPSTTYGEFMNDDDNLFGLPNGGSDVLQALGATSFGDPKSLLTTSEQPQHSTKPGAPGFSPPSHQDSSSSASSESAESDSPRTGSQTSADIMMTEDATFTNFKSIGGLPTDMFTGDGGDFTMLDGTLDSSMNADNHFNDNYFDFESASSSPSAAPTVDGQNTLSPENHTTTISTRSPNAKRVKSHSKAQSVSNLSHMLRHS